MKPIDQTDPPTLTFKTRTISEDDVLEVVELLLRHLGATFEKRVFHDGNNYRSFVERSITINGKTTTKRGL